MAISEKDARKRLLKEAHQVFDVALAVPPLVKASQTSASVIRLSLNRIEKL